MSTVYGVMLNKVLVTFALFGRVMFCKLFPPISDEIEMFNDVKELILVQRPASAGIKKRINRATIPIAINIYLFHFILHFKDFKCFCSASKSF